MSGDAGPVSTIPAPRVLPYGRQSVDEDDIAAVVKVLRGDWVTSGPAVGEFEQALSEFAGVPTVAVNSGTAALHCAYRASGLGPDTELITSPLTFVATAAAAVHLGARVKFVDVDDATLTIRSDAASAECGPATRAITAIDFAGHPADYTALAPVARKSGVVLIADAAHSLGASHRGVPVGSLADITTFSFHPVKAITTGEGGAVASANGTYLERARLFRNHGLVRDRAQMLFESEGRWYQEVHEVGLNYRIPDILCALGTSQLKKLPGFIARRRLLASRYLDLLSDVDGLRLPTPSAEVESAWHLFVVRVLGGRRKSAYDFLVSRGILVQVHYMPVHLHPAFRDLGFGPGMFPVAERAYSEIISLPLYPGLTEHQQDRVISEVRSSLGDKS